MYELLKHHQFDNFYMQIEFVYTYQKVRLAFNNITLGRLVLFTGFTRMTRDPRPC